MKLNLLRARKAERLSQEKPGARPKNRTVSKLNLAECARSGEPKRGGRPKTLRKKSQRAQLRVDLAVLEKNIKAKKFSLNKRCLSRLKQSKKFRTTAPKRGATQKTAKARSRTRIATFLRTERRAKGTGETPTATKVDLRQISLKRKRTKTRAKGDARESFNSLKLLQRSKQLSQEETLLILKSLESEKALRKLRRKGDVFFLKESKLRARAAKKAPPAPRKSSRRRRMQAEHDFKFGTGHNNFLLSRVRHQVQFNSDKKKC